MVVMPSMLPSVAIAAFAEKLIEGRRAIIFGSATHTLWEKALERGARLVHVCDPDPVRLAEAAARNTSPLVSFAPLSNQASLALRDGSFDLGIIDNLSSLEDPTSTIRLLRRALSPRGLCFITAPNPDVREPLLPDLSTVRHSLDYYTLYDVVRSEFPVVRMLGQMPFVGYSMAELAPLDNPEPTLDAGFVAGGTEEPEWFVAAASAHPFDIEAFTVIQIPVSDVLSHSSGRQIREQLRASRNAERSAVERLARLEAQQLEVQLRAVEERNQADLSGQIAQLKQELSRKENWISSLEARAAAADARSDDAEHQLEEAQQQLARAAQAEVRLAQLEKKLNGASEAEQRLAQLEKKLNDASGAEQQLAQLEKQLNETSQQVSTADQLAAETQADLVRLESQLHERGERLRELEAELKSVQRAGEQLLRDLEVARVGQDQPFGLQTWSAISPLELPQEPTTTDTAQSAEATSAWVSQQACESDLSRGTEWQILEDDRARLQADIHAATWRIDQLLSVVEKNQGTEEQVTLLKRQLSQAESRLNEQAALLHQLESTAIRG